MTNVTLEVTTLDGAALPAGFQPAAPTIEVRIDDNAILDLVRLDVFVTPGPPDAVPIALHLDDTGRWAIEQPVSDGATMTLWAGGFSPRIFGWISSTDLVAAAGDIVDYVFDWAVGRTDFPDECDRDEPNPYPWVSAEGTIATGAAHACAVANPRPDGTPRVEIRITSNRSYYQWVHFTSHPNDYVWVEDLPDFTRRALKFLTPGGDWQHTVLLAPRSTMTVGYLRPEGSSVDLRFDVAPDAATLALTGLAGGLGLAEPTELVAESRSSAQEP